MQAAGGADMDAFVASKAAGKDVETVNLRAERIAARAAAGEEAPKLFNNLGF